MGTTFGESHVPLGFDFGLEGLTEDQSLPALDEFDINLLLQNDIFADEMTELPFDNGNMHYVPAQTYIDPSVVSSEPAKSPCSIRSHLNTTEGSISLSPSAASQRILTPTSSNFESPYLGNLDDPESDANVSPSESEDYVVVSPGNGVRSHRHTRMSSEHARGVPSAPSSSQGSARSIPSPSTIPRTDYQAMRNPQWSTVNQPSSIPMSSYGDHYQPNLVPTTDFQLYGNPDLTANTGGTFNESFNSSESYDNLPFRPTHGHPPAAFQSLYQQPVSQAPSTSHFAPSASSFGYLTQAYPPNVHISNINAADPIYQSYLDDQPRQQATQPLPNPNAHSSAGPRRAGVPSSRSTSSAATLRPTPSIRSHASQRQRVQVRVTPAESSASPTSTHSGTSWEGANTSFNGLYPVIVKADSSRNQPVAAQRVNVAENKVQKGGRKKNTHLAEPSRQRSHAMRKVGACWRCAMQRDSCDGEDGQSCSRCNMQMQKGQTYFFPCDRSKLPDFVHDFLPKSLCRDHQRDIIEATVKKEVFSFHDDNPIEVYLSSGYGPPLRWRLHEFTPASEELLWQLQYFQDPQSGKSITQKKYSPPYGLKKLDSSDDAHFDQYLSELLKPFHLKELGESCYAEENLVDNSMFQCRLLDLLCQLYVHTQDDQLKVVLYDILRMMVITYIMGHTLTITEDTKTTVVSNIKRSKQPPVVAEYTSPRLANRQLKFFFGVMRNNIYEKILKWLQQTLHTAGKKEQTWLASFCVILGLAMVLEEVQRTIHCQADAMRWRNEATIEQASDYAAKACDIIDRRFKLLIGLFQCKYRDKKWGDTGSFGPGSPRLQDPVSGLFLEHLRELLVQSEGHLRSRENVPFDLENSCQYTTRLTARFLLPFLNLHNVS